MEGYVKRWQLVFTNYGKEVFLSGLNIGHKCIVMVGGWTRGVKVVYSGVFCKSEIITWSLELYLTFYLPQESHCVCAHTCIYVHVLMRQIATHKYTWKGRD